ncbi:hypothetical protein ACFOUP_12810 [Belliella kenyensis]|uniref:Alkyl sulfatase C-terminal n=1 Tax=Belliella kenyensis TaxID=1472724 RepID=A0ABV8EMM2_9BACT|nr:hypothetical protein [Belliella kenyensis]MCH7400854.1 hypothetical protein [Belliella kenyensis]
MSDDAVFSVAWAGQETSPNWFHIAREYTEKFLHQQQIRDVVGKQGIMTKALFYPFIDILMHAFPYTFTQVQAENETVVSIEVTTEIGGVWSIKKKEEGWALDKRNNLIPSSKVVISPDTAWKLFSKSWKPEQVIDNVKIIGDVELGKNALNIVAVMA